MNARNYHKVLAAIEANPKNWDQAFWHCGTSHCFAGFAQLMLRDKDPRYRCDIENSVIDDFGSFLEIDPWEAVGFWLTDSCRTLDDFRTLGRTLHVSP